jgi:exosome complex component RRP4
MPIFIAYFLCVYHVYSFTPDQCLQLENGQLVKVAAYLVKRLKQHFHSLKQYGVDMIIGCNGYIWIAASSEEKTVDVQNSSSEPNDNSGNSEFGGVVIPLPVRQSICRLANSVRVLSALGFLIYPDVIIDTYEASISKDIALKDMLGPEFSVLVAEREAARRSKKSAVL